MKNEIQEIKQAYACAPLSLLNVLERAQKADGHGWNQEVEKIKDGIEMADSGQLINKHDTV